MTIEIPLTKGQVATIDDEDADLALFKWRADFNSNYANGGGFLAGRTIQKPNGKRTTELMHRVILSRKLERLLLRSELTDHIHGLTLDNRRSELRLATHGQNQANKRLQSNNTSGFKGVSFNKMADKWEAQIQKDGKNKHLGFFDDPAEAHAAWREAAQKEFGEFARAK